MLVWQQTLWKKRCQRCKRCLSTDQTGYPHWSGAYNTLPTSSYLCSSQPSVCHGKCSLLFYIVINTHFWFCNIMTFDKSLWIYPTSFNISELVFKQVKSYQEILFVDHILSLWYPITISPVPEDMAPSAKEALSLSPTLCPSSSCWNIDVQHWKPGQTGVRDHEWHWTQLQSQRETRAMDNNLSMTTHMGRELVRKETVWRGERKETGVWCSVWVNLKEYQREE